MPNDRQLCLDAGMDDYLAKPFTKAGLGAVLFRWLPTCSPEIAAVTAPLTTPNAAGPWSIDTQRIDELRSLQGPARPGLLEKIIGQYLADGAALIEAMRGGFASGDADAVHGACHRFKSTSAFVGATLLAQCCEELDQICREGGLPDDGAYLCRIEEGYQEASSSLPLFLLEVDG